MLDFDSFEWETGDEQDAHSLFEAATPLDNSSLAADSGESSETVPPQPPLPPLFSAENEPLSSDEPLSTDEPLPTEAVPLPVADQPPVEIERDDIVRRPPRRSSRRETDPFFISWLLMALSLGLSSVAVSHPLGRYALMWTVLALAGVVILALREDAITLRISLQNLFWGVGWGIAVGVPLLFVGSDLLAEASAHIFPAIPDGAVFLVVVFVIAPTETVFFRYLVQAVQPVGMTALVASTWSILLFFPTMNVVEYPFVALIVATFLIMLSVLYSYVRQRNGLAAAWLCQTLVSLGWLFVPRFLV